MCHREDRICSTSWKWGRIDNGKVKTGLAKGRGSNCVSRGFKLSMNEVCLGVKCGLPGIVVIIWGLGAMSFCSQAWVKLWPAWNGSLKSLGFV